MTDVLIFGVIEPVATVIAGGIFYLMVERRLQRRDEAAKAAKEKHERQIADMKQESLIEKTRQEHEIQAMRDEAKAEKDKQQQEIKELSDEIREFRDKKFEELSMYIKEKLGSLDVRITGEADARRDLDKKMQTEYALGRELTAVDQRLADIDIKLQSNTTKTERTQAIVELIANHLNISLPGPKHGG